MSSDMPWVTVRIISINTSDGVPQVIFLTNSQQVTTKEARVETVAGDSFPYTWPNKFLSHSGSECLRSYAITKGAGENRFWQWKSSSASRVNHHKQCLIMIAVFVAEDRLWSTVFALMSITSTVASLLCYLLPQLQLCGRRREDFRSLLPLTFCEIKKSVGVHRVSFNHPCFVRRCVYYSMTK